MEIKEPLVVLDEHYNLRYPEGATVLTNAPQDVIDMTHPHWHETPPPHPYLLYGFGTAFFIMWVISTVGNGLVIYVYLKAKELRTVSNILVLNLALSDLLMITTHAPPVIYNCWASRFWMWGKRYCMLYSFLAGVFGLASAWMLVFIGYDRYNLIVKGIAGTKITAGKVFVMVLFSYSYPVFALIWPELGWGHYHLEVYGMWCTFDILSDDVGRRTWVLLLMFCNYFIPLCFLVYFYSQIVLAVVKHEKALRKQAKKMNVDSLRANKDNDGESAEMRIAKASATVVFLWWASYTPYVVVSLLSIAGARHLITPMVAIFPSFALKFANLANPVVFALKHPKFRQALAVHVPSLGIGNAPNPVGESASKPAGGERATTATTAT